MGVRVSVNHPQLVSLQQSSVEATQFGDRGPASANPSSNRSIGAYSLNR